MKMNKNSRVRAVGLSSTFALLALMGMAVFCPTTSDGAHAINCTGDPLACSSTFNIDFVLNAADSKQLLIDFVLNSAISISMTDPTPGTATATVQPTPTGKTVSSYTDFTVTSNGADNVGVYVYGSNGQTTLNGTSGNSTQITSITGQSNGLSKIDNNKWGYNLSVKPSNYNAESLEYNAVTGSKGTATPVVIDPGTQNLRLTFGTKIDTAIAPDTYTGAVDVQAVPNPTLTQQLSDASDELNKLSDI